MDPAEGRLLATRAKLDWLVPVLRGSIGVLWIVSGMVSLGWYPVEDSLALLRRVGLESRLILYGSAMLDIALGIATLVWNGKWLWRAQIGLVAHRTLIYENLTARENLRFFGKLYDLSDIDSRIERSLERVGLAKRGDDLTRFWEAPPDGKRPPEKRLPRVRRLVRGWSPIAKIEDAGERQTFDLSVSGPFHNFVAEGFVVHNSVNEYSTRYSIAIDSAGGSEEEPIEIQMGNVSKPYDVKAVIDRYRGI